MNSAICCAFARLTFHPDFPPVSFDNTMANGQPQTGSLSPSGLAAVSLEKPFEYSLVQFRRNADTFISNANANLLASVLCLNVDIRVIVGEFHRVLDKIGKDFTDAIETVVSTTPKLQLWSGTIPASCAAADAGDGAKI